jgi:hypothetical protein
MFSALAVASVHAASWHDPYYQYRIPLKIQVKQPGVYRLKLSGQEIFAAVNAVSEFKYRDGFFPYNHVVITERKDGREELLKNSGWFLGIDEKELIPQGFPLPALGGGESANEEQGRLDPVRNSKYLPVKADEPGTMYFCRFTNAGGGSSPLFIYEPIFPDGSRMRTHNYKISYMPRLLKQAETEYEALLIPDPGEIRFYYSGRFTGKLSALSLRKAQAVLLAEFDSPGEKELYLYFQPTNNAIYLTVPEKKTSMPSQQELSVAAATAEILSGGNSGIIAEHEFYTLGAFPATAKLTPETVPVNAPLPEIKIVAAANEKESFQLIIHPKRTFDIRKIEVEDLTGENQRISAEMVKVRKIEYVPIRRGSRLTPWEFRGLLGDPLTLQTTGEVQKDKGNFPLWITVQVPPGTRSGVYRGRLRLTTNRAGDIDIPLQLKVYDFELPDRPAFRTNLGLQYFAKGAKPLAYYHGIGDKENLKRLAHAYYEEMAANKLAPKNVALYSEIKFKWEPPPQGMNVDGENNFFRLYDWDFTEFNRTLDHFVNKQKVNQFCIYHTNAIASNIFPQLPGKELDGFNPASPFVTMGSQAFREMKMVGYGISPKSSYTKLAEPVTREQFDRLVTDYLRAIAANLQEHGFLRYATILIDESENDEQLTHFLRLLKNDPLLKQIKVTGCIQSMQYYYKKDAQGQYMFRDLIDTYVPQMDETYDRTEPYYFTDYGNSPAREKLLPYIVYTSRLNIDAPGINNRLVGFDVFRRGGSGVLDWEIALYNPNRPENSQNPWQEPYTLDNGAVCYFYPPLRCGTPEKPDFTVTPSLRLELLREAADDFEYAYMLEQLIRKADSQNLDTAAAKNILASLSAFFNNAVIWSQNDVYLDSVKAAIAREIENLKRRIK